MCGEKSQALVKARVEGAIVSVCNKCLRFGTPITTIRSVKQDTPSDFTGKVTMQVKEKPVILGKPRGSMNKGTRKSQGDDELEVVPDYAHIIREAREKMGMSQEELALKMMEKKHVLANIERGSLKPDIKTSRKLEKLLNVVVLEKF